MRLSARELNGFLVEAFPRAEKTFEVQEVTHDGLVLRCHAREKHLRPGGTISGPLLMTMADTAMYLAVLSRIGLVAMAVTTNLNINFMRKAKQGVLLGRTRLLKLGKRLAVGDVTIFEAENPQAVAHASLTYAIPPLDSSAVHRSADHPD